MTDTLSRLKQILKSEDFVFEPKSIEDTVKIIGKIDTKYNSLEEQRYLQTTQSPNPERYNREYAELKDFENTVQQFENLITPLSTYLTKFNYELDELSKELQNLKLKSVALASNLHKRQELEQKYVPIVSDLIIPPDVVKDIYNNQINTQWCENLQFLKDKQEILKQYEKNPELQNMKSLKELSNLLNLLEERALERIRSFIVLKIKNLRVIGTSSQVIQKELIQVKEIYYYLKQKKPTLALELKQAYIYTMRWYYQSHFKRYLQSLSKLKLHQFDSSFLIGIQSQSLFKKTTLNGMDNYNIGKRTNIIKAEDPTVLLGQIAEHNPVVFNLEVGFRSFNLALIDNGSVEYLFLIEFFQLKPNEIQKIFEETFKPTCEQGIKYTEHLINNTFDIFGILILIRLSQAFTYELQTRRIPVMEDYFNLQMIVLWPQFQKLIDLNVENMKRSGLKSTSIAEIHANKPHSLTVQFANLVYGFLKLTLFETTHVNEAQQEPLYNSLIRLNTDFELIITKLSKMSKKPEIFLYVNYSYILGNLNDCEGYLAKVELDHFKNLTEAYEKR